MSKKSATTASQPVLPVPPAARFSEGEPESTERRHVVTKHARTQADTILPGYRHRRALPAKGPVTVSARAVGPRLVLLPSDEIAALLTEAARAQLGKEWDTKREVHLSRFDNLIRRGTSRLEGALLTVEALGLRVEVPSTTISAVNRYRRRLARLLAPIPRVVWQDKATSVATYEEQLATGTTTVLRDSTAWWAGR